MLIQNDRPQIDLVLVGGGHAHVSVLRSFGMKPVPGLRITLITDVLDAPYSGMLPGYVEGQWQYDDMHIHLGQLCQFAGARLIHAQVEDINLAHQQIFIQGQSPVSYDFLSLNCGAIPDLSPIKGAVKHAIAVKPISHFLEKLPNQLDGKTQFSVVGGGAAGTELAIALRARFKGMGDALAIRVFSRSDRLVPQAPLKVSDIVEKACISQHIEIHHNADVSEIEQDAILTSNGTYPSDYHFIVTGVKPASWVSRLSCEHDANGFLLARKTFQLKGYDNVFAAGDVMQIEGDERPKAGVFAVRAGPILVQNIRRILDDKPLVHYRPQRKYLAIIGLGNGRAVGFRSNFVVSGKAVWEWKKWIDVRFMDRFNKLPNMPQPTTDYPPAIQRMRPATAQHVMYCSGCGSKAGPDILKIALHDACNTALELGADPKYLPSPDELSDSAHLKFEKTKPLKNHQIIQSIDTISQHISDPFIFGRIATLHAMSDIFVSGGEMHSAVATIALRRGSPEIQQRDLTAKLAGAMLECANHNAKLIGGHTIAADEASMGLAVTGLVHEKYFEQDLGSETLAIILTKPLGIGVILAAQMQTHVPSKAIIETQKIMLQSNFRATQILMQQGCVAMTDVTGFGLAGHLHHLMRTHKLAGAEIRLNALPLLDYAPVLSAEGVASSLLAQNRLSTPLITAYKRHEDKMLATKEDLMFDPQTSGGVVGLVAVSKAEQTIETLRKAGYIQASIIGHTGSDTPGISITE